MAKIEATLLPTELARVAAWKRKQPYFMATGASLLMAAAIPAIGNWLDMQQLESSSAEADRRKTQEIIREARDFRDKFNQAQTDTTQREQDIQNLLKLQDQKGLVPRLIALVHEAKPPMDPQLERVQSASELRELVQSNPTRFARTNRGQLIIESFRIEYVDKLASATVDTSPVSSGRQPGGPPGGAPGMPPGMAPGSTGGFINPYYNQPSRQEKKKKSKKAVSEDRGFVVHVVGRLLHGRNPAEASQWLRGYATNLRELSRRDGLGFYIPDDAGRNDKAISDPELRAYHGAQGHNRLLRPMDDRGEADRAQYPDPLTGEETQSDWKVGFSFKVKIGEPPEPESTESTEEVAGATADQSPA